MTTKEIANNTNDILNTTMVAYCTYKAGANIADYTKAGASIAKQIPDVVKTAIADSKETIQLGTQSELAGFGGYNSGLQLNVIHLGAFFDSIKNGVKNIMQDSSLGDGNFANAEGAGKTANGITRAAKYSEYWQEASLDNAVNKFAPDFTPVTTDMGKVIYTNEKKGIQVVYDKSGDYFRI